MYYRLRSISAFDRSVVSQNRYFHSKGMYSERMFGSDTFHCNKCKKNVVTRIENQRKILFIDCNCTLILYRLLVITWNVTRSEFELFRAIQLVVIGCSLLNN